MKQLKISFYIPLILIILLTSGCSDNLKTAKYLDSASGNIKIGQYDKASKDINAAIKVDPTRTQTYLDAIALLWDKKLYYELVKITNILIEKSERSMLDKKLSQDEMSNIYWLNSLAYWKLGNIKLVEDTLRKALQKNPYNANLLNSLGYLYADQNIHTKDALKLTKRAVKLQPGDAAFIDSLGWAYFREGKLQDSLKYLKKSTELIPNDPEVRYHLGVVYAKMGRKTEARIELKKALLLDQYMYKASKLLKTI